MGGGTAYTKGNSFFSSWIEEPFDLSPADISTLDLPGSKKAGIILRFRDVELVVSAARALEGDVPPSSKKRLIEFTGRTTEAIRKATTYFTAATTSTIRFYVATDIERAHLLHLVDLNTHVNPTHVSLAATPPPLAIPVVTLPAPPTHTPRVKQTIDEGFRALEEATDLEDRGEWKDALQRYDIAHRCFNQACPMIPSDRASTRQLLIQKCGEIQGIVADLHRRLAAAAPSSSPSSLPAHYTATVPPAQVPMAPPPQPISPMATLPPSSALSTISPPLSPPSQPSSQPPTSSSGQSVDERMHALHKYSEAVDAKRAQDERKPVASDLALRLAALKKETTVAPPLSTLEERLQRLRDGASTPPTSCVAPTDELVEDLVAASVTNGQTVTNDDDEDLEDDGDMADDVDTMRNLLLQAKKEMDAGRSSLADDDEETHVNELIQRVQDEVALEKAKPCNPTPDVGAADHKESGATTLDSVPHDDPPKP
ncbi:Aste57867_9123 [Aphanomyces stellatus]|uniref:Aste57867_9123 protein n=1 Tax=Aphanomyces stellatus TaxID=120398 RepID=A0A485KM03_9STRA|nr:hypothetical protein As57867_009087 [Aphanomyces stellatus]VFT86007.1 Aste57867_9123 [Aphanomyces stellatus]